MSLFSYQNGNSLWHTLDVRCKGFALCLLSLVVLKSGFLGNILLLGILMVILRTLGISSLMLLQQLKVFLLFLILIFFCRWMATPGEYMVTFYGFSLTHEGFVSGSLLSLRFLIVMLLGLILTASSRSVEIKNSVQWFLRPVPLVPEKRVAVMAGLALKFIPIVLDNARDVNYAVRSRCGNFRKNPLKHLMNLSWPLLKKTFQSADDVSLAMQARCYSENRTEPKFSSNGKEGTIILVLLTFSAGMLLIG